MGPMEVGAKEPLGVSLDRMRGAITSLSSPGAAHMVGAVRRFRPTPNPEPLFEPSLDALRLRSDVIS